jgi:hypothetical protein
MNHRVQIIDDHELPGEVGWLFVRQQDALCLWLRRSLTSRPEALAVALEEAWSTFCDIDAERLLSWPAA